MDMSRLGQGALIAAAAAAALLISMFLPWIGAEGVNSVNIWEISSSPFDIYLLIVVLIALVPAVVTMMGNEMNLPFGLPPGATNALLGGIATVLTLYVLIDGIPEGASRKIGMFIGLLAAAGVAFGGYLEAQEEAAAA